MPRSGEWRRIVPKFGTLIDMVWLFAPFDSRCCSGVRRPGVGCTVTLSSILRFLRRHDCIHRAEQLEQGRPAEQGACGGVEHELPTQ